jgi:hypothetical protein
MLDSPPVALSVPRRRCARVRHGDNWGPQRVSVWPPARSGVDQRRPFTRSGTSFRKPDRGPFRGIFARTPHTWGTRTRVILVGTVLVQDSILPNWEAGPLTGRVGAGGEEPRLSCEPAGEPKRADSPPRVAPTLCTQPRPSWGIRHGSLGLRTIPRVMGRSGPSRPAPCALGTFRWRALRRRGLRNCPPAIRDRPVNASSRPSEGVSRLGTAPSGGPAPERRLGTARDAALDG